MGLIAHYIRVFIRSHFKPMNQAQAQATHNKLSLAYFTLAWSVLGATLYQFIKIHNDPDSPVQIRDGKFMTVYDAVEKFGREENNKIFHVSGFGNVTEEVVSVKEAAMKNNS